MLSFCVDEHAGRRDSSSAAVGDSNSVDICWPTWPHNQKLTRRIFWIYFEPSD